MAKNVRVREAAIVGSAHLKMTLAGGPGGGLEAIAFRMGDMAPEVENPAGIPGHRG